MINILKAMIYEIRLHIATICFSESIKYIESGMWRDFLWEIGEVIDIDPEKRAKALHSALSTSENNVRIRRNLLYKVEEKLNEY